MNHVLEEAGQGDEKGGDTSFFFSGPWPHLESLDECGLECDSDVGNLESREWLGFPGGSVVRNLPGQCRKHGFDSWSRKISHAVEQLSPCTTTTDVAYPRTNLSATREVTAMRSNLRVTPRPQQENSPCSKEDPAQPKIRK